MSDPVNGAPTLETRMDDVRAVMDAVGSRRAAFFGLSEGAAMSVLFAATYPERTAALVLRSCSPRTMWAPDFPWGRTEEAYKREVERALQIYGPRSEARDAARSYGIYEDDELEFYIDYLRHGASPGMVEALYRMNKEIDIRHVLPVVRVPTLVLHGSEDQIVPVEIAAYTANHIPAARLVEVPGAGHLALGEAADRIVTEIERFLTVLWESGGWDEDEPDRMLATIMFTDIAGSTAKRSSSGIETGALCWSATTRWCGVNCCAFAVGKSLQRVTDSWPRSTARRGRFAARAPSSMRLAVSTFRCVRDCTPGSAR